MLERYTNYKQLCRLQLFGDDNIFGGTQYQYNTTNSQLIIQLE